MKSILKLILATTFALTIGVTTQNKVEASTNNLIKAGTYIPHGSKVTYVPHGSSSYRNYPEYYDLKQAIVIANDGEKEIDKNAVNDIIKTYNESRIEKQNIEILKPGKYKSSNIYAIIVSKGGMMRGISDKDITQKAALFNLKEDSDENSGIIIGLKKWNQVSKEDKAKIKTLAIKSELDTEKILKSIKNINASEYKDYKQEKEESKRIAEEPFTSNDMIGMIILGSTIIGMIIGGFYLFKG